VSLAIVTATLDFERAGDCFESWIAQARAPFTLYLVGQKIDAPDQAPVWADVGTLGHRVIGYKTNQILGVVPAFAIGVAKALEDGHEIIACFHDDLLIEHRGWDTWGTLLLRDNPPIGLVGFGGGVGLGDPDIYQKPYDPMQLARRGFVSNMRDAEAHGARSLLPLRVACLDGFSQIGRREYWVGSKPGDWGGTILPSTWNLFTMMQSWGIVHHAYDAALGCFAKRLGWEAWMLPIACHHFGGRTAVGDPNYTRWADQQPDPETGVFGVGGDGRFWARAHRIVYDQFKDVLPINP
jgi:hypothetical protein